MTWTVTAAAHIDHRTILRDPRTLECVTCGQKLILPRDPAGPTPSPEPFRRLDRPGVPMPSGWKDRVAAEIRARKEKTR
jgi:hypothetical protein